MNEQQLYEKIENYLQGSLSSQEKLSFEKEIASSKELAQQVQMHKAIANYAQAQGLVDFKGKLSSGMPSATSQKSGRNYWLYAGCGVMVLVVGMFLFNALTTNNADVSTLENTTQKNDIELSSGITKANNSSVLENKVDKDQSTQDKYQYSNSDELAVDETISETDKAPNTNDEFAEIDHSAGDVTNKDLETLHRNEKLADTKNNKVETGKEPEGKTNNCDDFDPREYLSEKASFNSLGEGRIEITNTNPSDSYKIFIKKSEKQKNKAVFEHLEQGVYLINIENEHGCIYTKKYTLKARKVD